MTGRATTIFVVALFLLEYYRGIMMIGGFSMDERLIKITTTGR